MDNHETLVKKQILNIFNDNKDLIIDTWINLFIENEKVLQDFSDLKIIFKKLLEGYIDYVKHENKDSFLNFVMEVVRKMDVYDLSYHEFIVAVHYFQESYVRILFKNFKNQHIEDCLILCNRIHNNIVSSIQSEYFNIKDSTLTAMLKLSELRDDITGHHVERTKEYTVLLSEELNLDQRFNNNIGKASLLHDIGKVAIRDEILLKPGKLTEDEYEDIKKHTIIGAKVISKVIKANEYINEYLYMAIDIALSHHEKYDGSGYPNGLSKNNIPLCARIFAITDAYDVITSERPYKIPLSHEEAVRRIQLDSGKHFDPDVVAAFLKIKDKFKAISDKYKIIKD